MGRAGHSCGNSCSGRLVSTPTRATILRLAGEAEVDPRTAGRFLRGEKMRPGLQLDRIRRAVVSLGIEGQVPRPADGETPRPEAGKPR